MKKLTVIAVIVLVFSILGYGTLAYSTVEDRAVSVITSGGVTIELVEVTADGQPFRDGIAVYPGAEASKIVTVRNIGGQPAWVRVRTDVRFDLNPAHGGGAPDPSLVTLDYNTQHWKAQDGWYYYTAPLAPGAETEPLFTKVAFARAMGNQYQESTARVIVKAAATQAKNNGDSATAAKGWPED